MRKTREETESSKLRILLAAEDEILSNGYGAANMENIAKAAGVSKSAIFWHYESKANLFRVVVLKAIERIVKITLDVFTKPKPIMDKCKEIIKLTRKDNAFDLLLIISDTNNSDEIPQEVLDALYQQMSIFTDLITQKLIDAKANGELHEWANLKEIFSTVTLIITGLTRIKKLKTYALFKDVHVTEDTIVDILFNGLMSYQKADLGVKSLLPV